MKIRQERNWNSFVCAAKERRRVSILVIEDPGSGSGIDNINKQLKQQNMEWNCRKEHRIEFLTKELFIEFTHNAIPNKNNNKWVWMDRWMER